MTSSRLDLEISNKTEYAHAELDFLGWLRNIDPERALKAAKAESLARVGVLKRLAAEGKREAASEWLDAFLEENPNQKLVIFTYHRESAFFFGERYAAPVIVGGVSMEKRDEVIQQFQTQADPRVLVASLDAAGAGIDLFAASNCVFFEMDWLPTTHTQATGRLDRPGQTSPVTAWWMVGRGTVEERIFELLTEREAVVAATTQGRREEAAPGAAGTGPTGDVLTGLLEGLWGSSKSLSLKE